MTSEAATKRPMEKPSGPISYSVTRGADVWPGTDKAHVRVLDGKMVIFQDYQGRDQVLVTVGGRNRLLPRAEWRALPAYKR